MDPIETLRLVDGNHLTKRKFTQQKNPLLWNEASYLGGGHIHIGDRNKNGLQKANLNFGHGSLS